MLRTGRMTGRGQSGVRSSHPTRSAPRAWHRSHAALGSWRVNGGAGEQCSVGPPGGRDNMTGECVPKGCGNGELAATRSCLPAAPQGACRPLQMLSACPWGCMCAMCHAVRVRTQPFPLRRLPGDGEGRPLPLYRASGSYPSGGKM